MNIITDIKKIIENDTEKFPNGDWKLTYNKSLNILTISPPRPKTYDETVFMGDWLSKNCFWNDYLFVLYKKYPIDIKFTNFDGCQIKYDNIRMRKWKIDKLING